MTTLTEVMCPECETETELVMEVKMWVAVPVKGLNVDGDVVLDEGLDRSMVTDVDDRSTTVRCFTCRGEFDESDLVEAVDS